ncbi:MAG TPA: 2-C-methyl-D-erythritol 4-phosphate cytidylyltransferase, partial [Streptosporangiaceae bacterium]|nr:2-C-methyl-D-erythritol 4-phosphate cytidylyltransferase [Streptosporangiaceae bacterium]
RADPGFTATDDCGVVLRYLPEVTVRVIPGSERNIKITYPRDLAIAEALLKADR